MITFHIHPMLEIALAIQTLKEWKIEAGNLALQGLNSKTRYHMNDSRKRNSNGTLLKKITW